MQTIYGSHAAIPPFRLLRPRQAAAAAAARDDFGGDAHYFAGGVDLVPALRAGRAVSALIALGNIESFAAIERTDTAVTLGAGLTYAGLAASDSIRSMFPEFAQAVAGVANVRVRHAATLGGNIMARNPAYDLLPALLALGARLVFTDGRGREESADGRASSLPAGLLSRIEIPAALNRRFVLNRAHKPALSIAVAVERRGGRLAGRAALGCAHAWPVVQPLDLGRAADFPALAAGAAAVAADFAARLPQPLDDLAASAPYRRLLAEVLVRRSLLQFAESAPA